MIIINVYDVHFALCHSRSVSGPASLRYRVHYLARIANWSTVCVRALADSITSGGIDAFALVSALAAPFFFMVRFRCWLAALSIRFFHIFGCFHLREWCFNSDKRRPLERICQIQTFMLCTEQRIIFSEHAWAHVLLRRKRKYRKKMVWDCHSALVWLVWDSTFICTHMNSIFIMTKTFAGFQHIFRVNRARASHYYYYHSNEEAFLLTFW